MTTSTEKRALSLLLFFTLLAILIWRGIYVFGPRLEANSDSDRTSGSTPVGISITRPQRDSTLIKLPRRVLFKTRPALSDDQIMAKISPVIENANTPSACLHGLSILKTKARMENRPFRGNPQVEALLGRILNERDGQAAFGHSAVIRTRFGLRFRDQQAELNYLAAAESHRDQCLALLGQLGIPTDEPFSFVDGSRVPLSQLLADSVASFHLEQDELAFTAIAYACYLAPAKSWSNRFGETFCFDQLADRLMKKEPSRVSCGGLHILQALIIMRHVHRNERAIMSAAMADRVNQYISAALAQLAHRQEPAGCWMIDCLASKPSVNLRYADLAVVATSHVLECFVLLPADELPEQTALDRSRAWLEARFKAASEAEIRNGVCPYSHTSCLLLSHRGDD